MADEDINCIIKSGKIAAQVLQYAGLLARPGINLLELAQGIEEKIANLGAKPAFPVNLSLNSTAAHFTPQQNEEMLLSETDLLKIDVGVQVDGFIGDTALTIGQDKQIINASEEALKEAIKLCIPSTPVCLIGKRIQEVIESHGFSPVINLTGHELKQNILHAGLTIPNHNNNDKTELQEGQVIAIEPFATSGIGKVIDGKQSGIYRLVADSPVRNPDARKLLQFIKTEYASLPFARRWLIKQFPTANYLLMLLEREGRLHHYNLLVEQSGAPVSQAEHTVIVSEKPIITTKYEEE